MSSAAPVKVVSGFASEAKEIKVYSHSPVFYWWPVWVVGFLMAGWTWLDNYHLAAVPEGTIVQRNVLIAPEGAELEPPTVHIARSKWPGLIFVLTVLLAVFVSNTTIRGPWTLFALAVIAAVVLLFNWLDWWRPLYDWFRVLRVHLNLGAYLVISVPIFLLWAVTFFVLDRRTYLVFSVGQVRIRDDLGEGEKAYDTAGVSFEKRPYDWLRPLLGFGAGDMVIRVGGPHPQVFELPNVIRVGKRLDLIEQRLRTKDVV